MPVVTPCWNHENKSRVFSGQATSGSGAHNRLQMFEMGGVGDTVVVSHLMLLFQQARDALLTALHS